MVCLKVVSELYTHRQQLVGQIIERVYHLSHFFVIVILRTQMIFYGVLLIA